MEELKLKYPYCNVRKQSHKPNTYSQTKDKLKHMASFRERLWQGYQPSTVHTTHGDGLPE